MTARAFRPSLHSTLLSPSPTAITASASAPLIYRASPIDPTLRSPSTPHTLRLPAFTMAPSATDSRLPSPSADRSPEVAKPPANAPYQQQDDNANIAQPALSTLASVASAPASQLRYVGPFALAIAFAGLWERWMNWANWADVCL